MQVESKKNPCYRCSTRSVGCHAVCPEYAARHAENEARKAAYREKYAIDTVVYEINRDASKRRKRRKNIR